jgi:DNA-binding MarR family transcriptional regulator
MNGYKNMGFTNHSVRFFCKKMSQTDFWKYMNVEVATVTMTINKLVKNGWVTSKKGEDQREKIVMLT